MKPMITLMKNISCLLILIWSHLCHAQGLPPIFNDTQKAIASSKTLVSFPEKTFLENILVMPDGSLLVNDHFGGMVYRVNKRGKTETYASVPGKVTGIAPYGKDSYVLTGNDENDRAVIYKMNKYGGISVLMPMREALFVNGIAHFKEDSFLVADSYKGCIWKIDAKTKDIEVWLSHELLERTTSENPTPAANGIKVFNHSVYVSNTQKQLLLKIHTSGDAPLSPEIFVEKVNIDDFIFDSSGNLYATTHVYNSVLKITPNKDITILAEQEQGVSGSTACALSKDEKSLYVSTNGGMYYPPPSGIENSKVVQIQIK